MTEKQIIEGEVINTSPLPKKINLNMDFFTALRAVQDGSKVTKLEWADNKIYGLKKDGFLMIHKADDKFYNWVISDGDMGGNDWIII